MLEKAFRVRNLRRRATKTQSHAASRRVQYLSKPARFSRRTAWWPPEARPGGARRPAADVCPEERLRRSEPMVPRPRACDSRPCPLPAELKHPLVASRAGQAAAAAIDYHLTARPAGSPTRGRSTRPTLQGSCETDTDHRPGSSTWAHFAAQVDEAGHLGEHVHPPRPPPPLPRRAVAYWAGSGAGGVLVGGARVTKDDASIPVEAKSQPS